jgi:hypothetical protein
MQRTDDVLTDGTGTKPFGPFAAMLVAAGVGALVLGILTTLSEASEGFASALQWSDSVGPLIGKTLIAAAVFVVVAIVLWAVWRDKDPSPRGILTLSIVLFALGLLLTFPVFFQLFESS